MLIKVVAPLTVVLLSALSWNTPDRSGLAGRGPSQSTIPSQRYTIRGTRNYTAVEAEVFYRHLEGGEKVSYPSRVEFNGRLMKNEPLEESKEAEGGCPRDTSLPVLSRAPEPVGRGVYTFIPKGYRGENRSEEQTSGIESH